MIRLHSFQANRHQIDEMIIFKTSCWCQGNESRHLAEIHSMAHVFWPTFGQKRVITCFYLLPIELQVNLRNCPFPSVGSAGSTYLEFRRFAYPHLHVTCYMLCKGELLKKNTNLRSMACGPSKQLTANDSTKNIFKKPWENWRPQFDCSRLLCPNIKVQKLSQPLGLVFFEQMILQLPSACISRLHPRKSTAGTRWNPKNWWFLDASLFAKGSFSGSIC